MLLLLLPCIECSHDCMYIGIFHSLGTYLGIIAAPNQRTVHRNICCSEWLQCIQVRRPRQANFRLAADMTRQAIVLTFGKIRRSEICLWRKSDPGTLTIKCITRFSAKMCGSRTRVSCHSIAQNVHSPGPPESTCRARNRCLCILGHIAGGNSIRASSCIPKPAPTSNRPADLPSARICRWANGAAQPS